MLATVFRIASLSWPIFIIYPQRCRPDSPNVW